MLIKAKTLRGYTLDSLNGDLGKVSEFYFDDRHWSVRYLVAETGNWLTGRQVLISPYALGAVFKDAQNIAVALTRKQIEDSPSLDSDRPVSRQFEEAYHAYYEWPVYGGDPCLWCPSPDRVCDVAPRPDDSPDGKAEDPHLRSTHAVSGYHIQALDGEIGHVDDFIIDDATWAIRYLVIDTQNWWPGKKVLLAPPWIERVDWNQSKVFVTLSRETIRAAPEYTDWSLITREFEDALHRHYNRTGYWAAEPPSPRLPAEANTCKRVSGPD